MLALCLRAPENARSEGLIGGRALGEMEEQRHVMSQSSFGWDWGPHLVPIGLWQSVDLKPAPELQLSDFFIRTENIGDGEALDPGGDLSQPRSEQDVGKPGRRRRRNGGGAEVVAQHFLGPDSSHV